MPAVADSSVIIHLAAIGQLDLLRKLHGTLLVPPAVWDEVVVQGQGRPGEVELRQAVQDGWMAVAAPSPNSLIAQVGSSLPVGEAEAILLAESRPGSLLLMDEAAGRLVATSLGVPVMGIVGLLVVAKQAGLLAELKPVLDQLRSPGGFRLSADLFRRALALVGERP